MRGLEYITCSVKQVMLKAMAKEYCFKRKEPVFNLCIQC